MTTIPLVGCAVTVLAFGAAALAHTDDPKGQEIPPVYTGPGYTEAEGGVGGSGISIFPLLGMSMRTWVTVPALGNHDFASDCWGYTSPSGREYAIIGLSGGTSFVEITNPGLPVVIDGVSGPYSTWRDIKVYQHYAYIVTEGEGQGQGLQVVDLGNIDDGQVSLVGVVTDGGSVRTHNVVIDPDSGFLYRCGGSGNGLRIYDLSDPTNPSYVADYPDRYVHDCEAVTMTEGPWAGREIVFTCSGFNNGWVQTGIDILDVTDKQDIQLLARYEYPNGAYSHQATLSPDRQYLYLNDEKDEDDYNLPTTMHVIDVSDLTNPVEVTTFTNGDGAITHNHYAKGDYVYAANYSSGVRVYDVSDPLAPSEIAYFDTQPDDEGTNYNGLWSNFPYFPSGTVIGSDRSKGLFVWTPEFIGDDADINDDGFIGVDDLIALISSWGPCPPPCPEDINGDGTVDIGDLVALLEAWD